MTKSCSKLLGSALSNVCYEHACWLPAVVPATMHADGPGRSSMTLISVLGTSGKTTTSWLIRGLLEQAGQLTGMLGSIEYALAEHLMSPDGHMWLPSEPDPAAGRECSSPFHLVPYRGRYCIEETTPSGLRVQVSGKACKAIQQSCIGASWNYAVAGRTLCNHGLFSQVTALHRQLLGPCLNSG